MIMTDPIADMLTRVRNAIQARHTTVDIPANKEKVEIAKILKAEGFITEYEVNGDVKKTLTVTLKYGPNNEKVINGIKRISSPGLRVYTKAEDMPRVLNGLGIAIISTSHGLLTDKEARTKNVGGEVVAYVW
ncbi:MULTISPECIES: 30S ribosomal protein S8 [unclassified Breznakia]|uniref:30S ribosomal protein S8 n=1 Tax=unclassified Breznakia TaxID=2623764 RepID=UPI002473856C|nr:MULTISPECIES: 30S ribosomal protein S8 [unclassified Breznakia]MDH6366138.1 small subunit ribosomal protein S8 [Breznakia sp. PH1-1]MDH6403231.1 small subunit ribosomal protein S8 [Breznakia sp. PF1-11]MDH6410940.1 small subunit ribosomal protein S8 [Breznakia sp. PFB1-11]MDH6413304.1 small subunit ribosomal protein S8 [Breznakia sp. PFB1-14]MDH6416069.1 small subunit ribosomal protein S8 [Breznakia sp. PFB1-4]